MLDHLRQIVTSCESACYLSSMRASLALTVLVVLAPVARAEEPRPRSIWLECKAPAGWPAKATKPMHLTCRINDAGQGPAFWQTLNPFAPGSENLALVDPFEVEATAHLIDPFAGDAHARATRPLDLPSATIDPFQGPPAPAR
jgi:hypothetical protein